MEMANLMIVMQTTLHNPNIKSKLPASVFVLQGKDSCPKSWDKIGDEYMQTLYDNVRDTELYSPLSRSWYDEGFNEYDLTMCNIKTNSVQEKDMKKVNQWEFVSCADLTEKSLFDFNNDIDAID